MSFATERFIPVYFCISLLGACSSDSADNTSPLLSDENTLNWPDTFTPAATDAQFNYCKSDINFSDSEISARNAWYVKDDYACVKVCLPDGDYIEDENFPGWAFDTTKAHQCVIDVNRVSETNSIFANKVRVPIYETQREVFSDKLRVSDFYLGGNTWQCTRHTRSGAQQSFAPDADTVSYVFNRDSLTVSGELSGYWAIGNIEPILNFRLYSLIGTEPAIGEPNGPEWSPVFYASPQYRFETQQGSSRFSFYKTSDEKTVCEQQTSADQAWQIPESIENVLRADRIDLPTKRIDELVGVSMQCTILRRSYYSEVDSGQTASTLSSGDQRVFTGTLTLIGELATSSNRGDKTYDRYSFHNDEHMLHNNVMPSFPDILSSYVDTSLLVEQETADATFDKGTLSNSGQSQPLLLRTGTDKFVTDSQGNTLFIETAGDTGGTQYAEQISWCVVQ